MFKSFFKRMKLIASNRTSQAKTAILVGSITLSQFAHSAGLSKVNSIMEKVSSALQTAAVVTVTVAVFWAGYKIVFGGQTFREAAPILIGGVVIGSAAQIASLLVG